MHIRVDGEVKEIVRGMKTDRYKNHNIEVVIDKLQVQDKDDERLEKERCSSNEARRWAAHDYGKKTQMKQNITAKG